jgi:calcium permeable stress-gated cation channel
LYSHRDLIWENLALNKAARRTKRLANMAWVTFLTLLWTPINACIAIFLSNLQNLGRVWPSFQAALNKNPKGWAVVAGIASPAITSLVYVVLPIIFRRLSIRGGDTTKTSRERRVIHDLYAFFCFNNLVVFSLFSAVWAFVSTTIDAKKSGADTWEAIQKGNFYVNVLNSLCLVSTFWVTWLLQRNLGAAVDLVQIVNLFCIWFMRTFMSPTPRQRIEWTAPPPFDYAIYYNYFLFYSTVALCFATLQPIVLPVTALYFAVDSALKKYLLMYVFVTKTESDGQMWRILYNRLLFAAILANTILSVVVKARGTWAMIGAMVPLPLLLLGFKYYCRKRFDDDIRFYVQSGMRDGDSEALRSQPKQVGGRVQTKFGHPALYKPLITPMVHSKAKHVLGQIYRGRLQAGAASGFAASDIALQPMSSEGTGKSMPGALRDVAPFEIVSEGQQDFTHFKNRTDFREAFSGGIYGNADDLLSERIQTPRSYMGHGGAWSPGSTSRASTPSPSRSRTGSSHCENSAVSNEGTVRFIPRKQVEPSNIHPAFRHDHQRRLSQSPLCTPPLYHDRITSHSRAGSKELESVGTTSHFSTSTGLRTRLSPGFPYGHPPADESEARLLGNTDTDIYTDAENLNTPGPSPYDGNANADVDMHTDSWRNNSTMRAGSGRGRYYDGAATPPDVSRQEEADYFRGRGRPK